MTFGRSRVTRSRRQADRTCQAYAKTPPKAAGRSNPYCASKPDRPLKMGAISSINRPAFRRFLWRFSAQATNGRAHVHRLPLEAFSPLARRHFDLALFFASITAGGEVLRPFFHTFSVFARHGIRAAPAGKTLSLSAFARARAVRDSTGRPCPAPPRFSAQRAAPWCGHARQTVRRSPADSSA
ncbi:hypothetical protein AWB69_03995 [Caballeronia udeis]|uniref:Uncharacterized protein n=1 Tax=Caballeronia udeis TaxID=1232866 RepID=A0A158H692_9BURK|nr:hypothetical protein AWB69_03995 [Caballeronia udeis]